MAMPNSTPRLVDGTRRPGSYSSDVMSGSHCSAIRGLLRSAGTTAYVIDTGQPWPPSTCDQM